MISIQDISSFFQFLGNDNEIFTYAVFDKESKTVLPKQGVLFGQRHEIIEHCQKLEASNTPFTLHTTLNRTKLSGRKRKDIESPRVICIDFDRELPDHEIKALVETYEFQLVVESSPKRYHLYFKVSPQISIEKWIDLELGINFIFQGDLNLAQPGHTIRVPGVERTTKDGKAFMPTIRFLTSNPHEWTEADILSKFPNIYEKAKETADFKRKQKKEARDVIRSARKGTLDISKAVKNENRNSTLFSLIFAGASSLNGPSPGELLHMARLFNHGLKDHPKGPLSDDELTRTFESALMRGTDKKLEILKRKEEAEMQILGCFEGESSFPTSPNGDGTSQGTHLSSENTANVRFKYDYSTPFLAQNRFTEGATFERFLQKWGHRVIRSGETFYVFDSRDDTWKASKEGQTVLSDYVEDIVKDIFKDERFITDCCMTDEGEISEKLKRKMEEKFTSTHFASSLLTTIKRYNGFETLEGSAFDKVNTLFFCKSGVIDLISKDIGANIRKPRPEDYLLRKSKVEFKAGATCPKFERFVAEVFDGHAPLIKFMQELFGYSLTGSISEQKLFLHYGEGANGKSKMLEALAHITGAYHTRMDCSSLSKAKNAFQKEFERIGAKTEGKRVVIVDDLDTNTQWNEGVIKNFTARTIPVRMLYAEARDVPNRAKFHIGCNTAPSPEAENKAIIRRMCIIPYEVSFEPSPDKERELQQMILDEGSGILNWAIQGLHRMVYEQGGRLIYPAEIENTLEAYREQHFNIENTINEMFIPTEVDEWHDIEDLLTDVNLKLETFGKNISKDHLGKILSKKFERKRTQENRTRTMKYKLCLNYERKGL